MHIKINTSIKILVIGDLMIDHYINGTCERISPEAPVPVVDVTHESHTLGGAGNVLNNIKAFGCHAAIMSVTGNDDGANIIEELLNDKGIATDGLIKDNARCTTIKSRVLAANHQLIRLDREVRDSVTADVQDQIIEQLKATVGNYNIVLLSDYNKGLLSAGLISSVVEICHAADIRVMVDPKGLDFSKYKGVNLIKPNKKEAGLATGIIIKDDASLAGACQKIQEITGCDEVVVTLSEQGIALYNQQKLTIIPTRTQAVIDVTGAGDTVLAALGVALSSGHTLHESCLFANQAAAIVVSKVGSATATLHEINSRSYLEQ